VLNGNSFVILLLIFIMSFCSSQPFLALITLTNYYQQAFLPPFQAIHEYGDQHSPSRGSGCSIQLQGTEAKAGRTC